MTICHITAFLAYNATSWKFCINPNIIPTSYEPIYTVPVVQYLTTGYKNNYYCVVPENIHTPHTEDSLSCTPDSPGFSIPGGL